MSPTTIVFRKELRDMMRDKRVRTSAFFGPMILIFVLMAVFGTILNAVGKPSSQTLHIVRTENPIAQGLKSTFKVVEVASREEGEALIRKGDAKLVLEFPASNVAPNGQVKIAALYDPKQQLAQVLLGGLKEAFRTMNQKALETLLVSRGLPKEASEPLKLEPVEVKVGGKSAGEFLVSMLPYLIVIWAFYGGMGIVTDLVAGEKEKNTLETLLVTPVARRQIVVGKFLALSVVCLLSSLSSVVGFEIVRALNLFGAERLFEGSGGLSAVTLLGTVVVLVPMVAFFAGMLLTVSTIAKNSREAQTYLGLLSFVVLMPAIFSQVIGLTGMQQALWVHFVPVLNTANMIRTFLLSNPDWLGLVITCTLNLALGMVFLAGAVKLFNREQVLTRV